MTDINAFLERHAEEIFHVPYYLAQEAIGETDGGIASLFESDGSGYGSGFANAGGHRVVEILLREFPTDVITDRVAAIAMPQIEVRFESAEKLTKDAIVPIAEEVTKLWHGALQQAFPEVANQIGDYSPATVRALKKYLDFQHIYTEEHDNAAAPAP